MGDIVNIDMINRDSTIPDLLAQLINKLIENPDETVDALDLDDRIRELIPNIKHYIFLMKQALNAAEDGRLNDSIEILKIAADEVPDITYTRAILANSYSLAGYPVKAIEVWKELCTKYPESAYFSFRLSEAYLERDWNKKAFKQFEHTLALDPDNVSVICYIVDCLLSDYKFNLAEKRCSYEIDRLKEKGIESLELYSQAFFLSLLNNTGFEREYLSAISNIIRSHTPDEPEEYNEVISDLISSISSARQYGLLSDIRELTDFLTDVSDDVLAEIDDAERNGKIDALEDTYPEIIFELISHQNRNFDVENSQYDIIAIECSILADIDGYLPYIKKLSLEQPDIYDMHNSFFDELMSGIDTKLLLKKRIKMLDNNDFEPILMRADGTEIDFSLVKTDGSVSSPILNIGTFRRDGPKIGRNELCPCGSGKKYKKCHGS